MTDMTRETLEAYASKCDIDVIGVASVDRFADVPPQFNPLSIYPEATSVIVCMQEIPRGVFRGIEEGTLWQRAPRQIVAYYLYQFARYLEDEGCLAVPCSPLAQDRWPEGIKFRSKIVEPNVYPSLEHAAVAAGLGEIGINGQFLSPQFGTRQALGMLITDLAVDADPLFEGKICGREDCMACVRACPMGAMGALREMNILGKSFACAEINKAICRRCPNGAYPDTTLETAMPNRLTAACGRACLAHLDAQGKLEKQYHCAFRRRPEWVMRLEEMK